MSTEWDHSFRCSHCGGLNDLDAEWCMQCSERLRPPAPRVDLDEGRPSAREVIGGALDIVAGHAYEGDDEALRHAFSVSERGVTWNCSGCGNMNPIDAEVCTDCGRAFAETAHSWAGVSVAKKQSNATLKAAGLVLGGAVVMRLVAGLISPWAAGAFLGGAVLRFVVKYLRD